MNIILSEEVIIISTTQTRTPGYARVKTTGEVLNLSREVLGPVEDPVTPSRPGRDPMAKLNTDKARFFSRDWRQAWPQDFTVHRPDGAA